MSALDMVWRLQPFELACAFPANKYLFGGMTTVEDVSHHGLARANPLFVNSKSQAVKLIVATNYWRANAYGHGNRARRRAERLFRFVPGRPEPTVYDFEKQLTNHTNA